MLRQGIKLDEFHPSIFRGKSSILLKEDDLLPFWRSFARERMPLST
jgi:hypothetical protein